MNIAFEEFGEGFPLILLHAFPLSRKMWMPQTEALAAEKKFRVILPDLRGFGETTNFADINTMEDMANDISELLETLKIEQAVIGGLSMGGYIAFNLYRLHPEKFGALILCDTSYASDTDEKREKRFDLIEKIETQGPEALIEDLLPHLISDFTKQENESLVKKLKEMFSEANPQAAIAALRGMAERRDHAFILEEIRVPTLLIFGEDDQITNLEIAETMKEKISSSQLVKIKNAGHYSNLEQPEIFNETLIEFLEKLELSN